MTKELLAEFPLLPRASYYEGHAYSADQMRDYALTVGEWLQESSYRAGAKAGYNLGLFENNKGLADLLEAHHYPRPKP